MPIASVLKGLLHKHDKQQQQHASTASSTSSSSSSAPPPPHQEAASSSSAAVISQPEQAHLAAPSSRTQPQANSDAATAKAMDSHHHHQQHASGSAPAQATAQQSKAEDIVRREAEQKAKRDQSVFEGLPEGLVLGRKMGDGAFSNVFEATLRPSAAQLQLDPSLGKVPVKVAVKCVRKFELNQSQVSQLSSASSGPLDDRPGVIIPSPVSARRRSPAAPRPAMLSRSMCDECMRWIPQQHGARAVVNDDLTPPSPAVPY